MFVCENTLCTLAFKIDWHRPTNGVLFCLPRIFKLDLPLHSCFDKTFQQFFTIFWTLHKLLNWNWANYSGKVQINTFCNRLGLIFELLLVYNSSMKELQLGVITVQEKEEDRLKGDENRSGTLRVALVCGGPSEERGISLNSARSVLDHLEVLYNVFSLSLNYYLEMIKWFTSWSNYFMWSRSSALTNVLDVPGRWCVGKLLLYEPEVGAFWHSFSAGGWRLNCVIYFQFSS